MTDLHQKLNQKKLLLFSCSYIIVLVGIKASINSNKIQPDGYSDAKLSKQVKLK